MTVSVGGHSLPSGMFDAVVICVINVVFVVVFLIVVVRRMSATMRKHSTRCGSNALWVGWHVGTKQGQPGLGEWHGHIPPTAWVLWRSYLPPARLPSAVNGVQMAGFGDGSCGSSC